MRAIHRFESKGKKITATYYHSHGSLPILVIKKEGKITKSYRGSSLGPINAHCRPDKSDRKYWESLAED